MKKAIFLFSLLIILISCSSDDDDSTMTPTPTPTADVTYTGTVKAIIDGNCLNCHGSTVANGASISFTTLTQVQQAVTNNGLISRISSGDMPRNASPLSAAQIQAIKDWQSGGFK